MLEDWSSDTCSSRGGEARALGSKDGAAWLSRAAPEHADPACLATGGADHQAAEDLVRRRWPPRGASAAVL